MPALRSPTPTATAAGTAHASATSVVRKPSGMCMVLLAICAEADDREVGEARAVAELALDQRPWPPPGVRGRRPRRRRTARRRRTRCPRRPASTGLGRGRGARGGRARSPRGVEVAVDGREVAVLGELLGGLRARVGRRAPRAPGGARRRSRSPCAAGRRARRRGPARAAPGRGATASCVRVFWGRVAIASGSQLGGQGGDGVGGQDAADDDDRGGARRRAGRSWRGRGAAACGRRRRPGRGR